MRDKILGANYFDRVLYILVDPDEFPIASYDYYIDEIKKGRFGRKVNKGVKQIYEGAQKLLLGTGEIKTSTLDEKGKIKTMKIVKRKDEGHLSFGSLSFSIIRDVSSNSSYGVKLLELDMCDVMIDENTGGKSK